MAAKYTPEGERPLSNQTDLRVTFFDSVLTVRLAPGSWFQ